MTIGLLTQTSVHLFVAIKKTLDRVWHEGLGHVKRKFKIKESFVQAHRRTSMSTKQVDHPMGDLCMVVVGVCQGCPLFFCLYFSTSF